MKLPKSSENWESDAMSHVPVLLHETIEALGPRPGETFVDGTFGAGGHALALAERLAPGGRLIAIDRDPERIAEATRRIGEFETNGVQFMPVCTSYGLMREAMNAKSVERADGVLVDLGFSSMHIDRPERGFSFQDDGPLDMRYDRRNGITAAEVVNTFGEEALHEIIHVYGEEGASRRIAHAIVAERKNERILTTRALARVVERVKGAPRAKSIHPATLTFQAIRIYVNDEVGTLKAFLSKIPEIMAPGGRVAVISFHGLEDALVKDAFRKLGAAKKAELLTKRPIVPTEREISENPRSRSSKLRAIKII
jgi:16S rRNA (cytosine1402-N4)-methyltransferase